MKDSASEHHPCRICSQIGDKEWASHKYGWEDNDTSLPFASQNLVVIRDLKPNSSGAYQLWQCPKCMTYNHFESDYEYLVTGSEDEQSLKHLNAEEAGRLLDQPSKP